MDLNYLRNDVKTFSAGIIFTDGCISDDDEITVVASSFEEAEEKAKKYLKKGEQINRIKRYN